MPVRAYIQFEIICDRCLHRYSYTSEDVEENWSEHREEIEKALRRIGYLIVDKLTLCPDCVDKIDV